MINYLGIKICYSRRRRLRINYNLLLAGIGSGFFKIFEGAATLGATLMDLGVDQNRAEAVEAYFDEINPFDEAWQKQQLLVKLQN